MKKCKSFITVLLQYVCIVPLYNTSSLRFIIVSLLYDVNSLQTGSSGTCIKQADQSMNLLTDGLSM